jgi:hypothetical protein
MRTIVTTAATALALALATFTTPAMADQYVPHRGDRGQETGQYQDYGTAPDFRGGPSRGEYDHNRRAEGRYDFDRQEGAYRNWEDGWSRPGHERFGNGRTLHPWKMIRRLERQGFYGVRGLRPSERGWGWRAFAFTYRGQPVLLRINPYSGAVIDVRRV